MSASASWLGARGVALALVAAALLSWPMLLVTAPMGYFDTQSYLDAGRAVLDVLGQLVAAPDAGGAAAAAATAGEDGVRSLRSFPYAAFVAATAATPLGLAATTWLQAALVLLMLLPLLPAPGAARPAALLAALALVGGLSTLPWFASYAMPDLLAAAVVLFYALLAGPMDRVPPLWQAGLALVAAFAVVSHYGHIPLAAALALLVVLLRLRRPRALPRVAALAALPVLLAGGVNLLGSAATLGEASVAPKRLPILLARSLDDGPAARHLAEACPEAGYALCDLFPDGVPSDLNAFLWEDGGVMDLPTADLDRVRDEEAAVLLATLRAYPAEQAWALAGNALLQLVTVGTGEVQPLAWRDAPNDAPEGPRLATSAAAAAANPALMLFDGVTKAGTLAGALLLVAAWPGAGRELRLVAGVAVAGLLLNAAIFGGLSVPVDRYQSRVAWLLPALGAILWLRRAEARP